MHRLALCLCLLAACNLSTQVAAQEALHTRIDALIEAAAGGLLADLTADADFHRRVYLDLAGRIPSVAETDSFLADAATDKREQLIDRLLASDDHVRRFSQVLNV